MTEIGPVLGLLLRGSDTEEMDIGEVRCGGVVGAEAQSTGSEITAQQIRQFRFIEGDLAGGEFGNLPRIDIDPKDLVVLGEAQ